MYKALLVAGIVVTFSAFVYENEPKPYPFPDLKYFPTMPQNPSNLVTVEGAELGKYLFYDPILSADSSVSCASCHKQEFAFSDSPNALSKGVNNQLATRNTSPLFNLAWYDAMFWDGRSGSIEEQAFHPVRTKTEMGLNWSVAMIRINRNKFYKEKFRKAFGKFAIDSTLICKAIAQFERTLISNNSKFDRVLRGKDKLNKDELEGYEIVNDMTRAGCLHCHTTDADALGTIRSFSNNGLDSVLEIEKYADKGLGGFTKKKGDYGKFKIPSLRNILFTAPYMHDGRFKTIEAVVDFYSEHIKPCVNIDSRMEFARQGGPKLDKHEKRKVIAFLKALSDSSFVTNAEFANPFPIAAGKKN